MPQQEYHRFDGHKHDAGMHGTRMNMDCHAHDSSIPVFGLRPAVYKIDIPLPEGVARLRLGRRAGFADAADARPTEERCQRICIAWSLDGQLLSGHQTGTLACSARATCHSIAPKTSPSTTLPSTSRG